MLTDDQRRQIGQKGDGDEDEGYPDHIISEEGFHIPHEPEGAQKDEEDSADDHSPLDGRHSSGGQNQEGQEKSRGRSVQKGVAVSPQSLEDHDPSGGQEDPLEEKDSLPLLKSQILGGDGRKNHQGGQEDDHPLECVGHGPWPGWLLVQPE